MGYVKNIYVDIVLNYVEKEMTWKQQERVRNRQKKKFLERCCMCNVIPQQNKTLAIAIVGKSSTSDVGKWSHLQKRIRGYYACNTVKV